MATLEELKQKKQAQDSGIVQNPESLRKLSKEELRKVLPPKEDTNTAKEALDKELSDLDNLLSKEMEEADKKATEFYDKQQEENPDAIFDAPVEDIDNGLLNEEEANKALEDAFTNAVSEIKEDPNVQAGIDVVNNVNKETPENMEIDDLLKELDDDMFDRDDDDEDDIDITDDDSDDDDEDDEEEQQKMLKDMQAQIESNIKPFNNIIDLKSFKISTKPKNATEVLKEAQEGPTATWVLLDSKSPFTCTSLKAVEIENLDPNKTRNQNGRIDALKQMYGTLFRHYTSPNKPKSLEEWVKTISFSDQDNLIFGYYKATFGESNYITYACEKCKEVKVEKVPIDDCIKYKDDETKQEVQDILQYGDPTHKGEIKATLIQVSDTLAVSIKSPSIYNIVFEFGVLDAEFTRKFSGPLGVVGYIEDIYSIDTESQQLIPIKIKEDPRNITKSVKRRIRAKVEILKTLTPDQYNILTAEIAKISTNAERITYCMPEYTCKKCGEKINETEMTAQQLLFMRHQLVLIKSLSTE